MAKTYDYDMGVIGGGAGGLTVASGAAQLGAKTLLIEKSGKLGGDCLHYGCVPSKTLIKTAKVRHAMRRAKEFGLPEVQLAPVEFSAVAERIASVIAAIQKHDSPERFCSLGAEIRFGNPRFLDEHAVELDGTVVTAAKWTLATGSRAMVPDIPGLAEAGCLTNEHLFSLEKLPKSLIVLGAGPIAIEMAQAFARLGSQVSVIQRSSQILSKEDKDMADAVMQALASEGVSFYLNAGVRRVEAKNGLKTVYFEQDGKTQSVSATDILAALGRLPNIEGLGLEAAGVEASRRGVIVDERMRTSQSHIYAAGDITGEYAFTHAAGYEGGIVITNAVFRLPRRADYAFMPWCTYCEPELGGMGLNEKRAKDKKLAYAVVTEDFADNDRARAEGAIAGRIKLLLDEKERPLGVQILGPSAGDLLGEWAAVFAGKTKMSTLAGAVHPYPTLAEINKRVAGDVFSPKIFSDKVKKGLSFLFHYKGRACSPDSGQAS
jgi:pyruvate/2-oxoglutarate dehydrogenase complex dihydrolipoamide dehydrogenase (E3) component